MLNLNFQNGTAPALNARNMNAIVEAINTMQTQLANPFTFKGGVSSVSNLPSSGNTINDTYYVTAETCLYAWDGNSWEVASLSEGDYLAKLEAIEITLDGITERQDNLFVVEPNFGDGFMSYQFDQKYPPGTYSAYINVSSTKTDENPYFYAMRNKNYTTDGKVATARIRRGKDDCFVFTADEAFQSVFIFASYDVPHSSGYQLTVNGEPKLYSGTYVDNGGVVDVTNIIQSILRSRKFCCLQSGDYLIKNLVMPDNSILCGEGGANLYFDENAHGVAVMMGTRCTVKDLSIFGAPDNIILPPSDFEPETGTVDYLSGIQPTYGDGWIHYTFDTELPAGDYVLNTNMSSTKEGVALYAKILDTSVYNASHVLDSGRVGNGEVSKVEFHSEAPIKSIFIFAASTVTGSSGYTISLTEPCRMYSLTSLVGTRHGVAWQSADKEADDMEFGRISNCRIEHFDGSGIRARDTGTPTDNNLAISDCFIRNCAVGIYIQRNAEYLRISNCTVDHNWYGLLNRGGNNYISNCGIDSNVVGIQLDNDEGVNGGHGAITGCSINHTNNNAGYGLVIRGTGRELVSNCNLYYSDVALINTDGNIISNCGFGRQTTIDITSGRLSLITNCVMFGLNDITINRTDNTVARIVNCWTRSGYEVIG